jgi:formate hydrogenlyase transcriptional activator
MTKRNNKDETLQPFYKLVHEIASRLVGAQAVDIDTLVDECLEKVGLYFNVSQVALGQWEKSGELQSSLRMWGDTPAGDFLHAPPPGPDAYTHYCRKGSLAWNCVEDLNELPQFQEHCRQLGVAAGVFCLHRNYGSHAQGISMSKTSSEIWPDDTAECLAAVGEVLFNALYRRQAELDAEQAFIEIKELKERLTVENESLRQEVQVLYADDELIGNSHSFRTTIYQAQQVAPVDSTVLLLGETGVGKGLIARKIHQLSSRSDRPLVTVNCASLPAPLIESELFGHEKGAFTGAVGRKKGRFELAQGGTLFLDEIGDLPIELQAKLLRVLQDQVFERLGSTTTITVDVRVIAATNRNLESLITQGEFRADLYYRLGVFPIQVPPLRNRRDDIPLLVWFFVSELQYKLGKTIEKIPTPSMDALITYQWPGNIRELKNVIERAMILSPGSVFELGEWFARGTELKDSSTSTQAHEQNGESIEEVERAHIEKVLKTCGWKVTGKDGAAERLGLKRTTLQSRMKKLGIVRPRS